MIYLLFDNPNDKEKVSFITNSFSFEIKEIYSPKWDKLIIGWIIGSLTILKLSKCGKRNFSGIWYSSKEATRNK